MRILFLNHVSVIGGAEKSLLGLLQSLPADRYDTITATPSDGPLTLELIRRGCRICHLPLRRLKRSGDPFRTLRVGVQLISGAAAIARFIRRENVDVVHSNSTTAHLYGGVAARLARVPAVWHCRDMVALGVAGRLMYRLATRVVAVSHAVAERIRPCFPADPSNLAVIHNGIDVKEFQPMGMRDSIRRRLGLGKDQFVSAMVGHWVPWKRHDLFLQAAARVAKELPGAHFLVVGDDLFGEAHAYRQELIEKTRMAGLTQKVTFSGFCDDMPTLLEGIDLLVHPPVAEPFGRVVAEAMAMARPVIVVNQGGPSELVRDGEEGIHVPPDDVGAMGAAMLRCGRAPEVCRAMGDRGRARIVQEFGMDRFQVRIRALYESLDIGRPGSRPCA